MAKAQFTSIRERLRASKEQSLIESNKRYAEEVQNELRSVRECYKREDILKITDKKELQRIIDRLHSYTSSWWQEAREELDAEARYLINFTSERMIDVLISPECKKLGRPTMLENYQSGKECVDHQAIVDYYLMAHRVDLSDLFAQEQARLQRARKEPITPEEQLLLDRFFSQSQTFGPSRKHPSKSKRRQF